MNLARIKQVSLVAIIIMIGALLYGFMYGDLSAEGSRMLEMAWGKVTLVDFYVGILIFSAWVWYREASVVVALLWIVAFVFTGNLATAIYLFMAVLKAEGDRQVFMFGVNK